MTPHETAKALRSIYGDVAPSSAAEIAALARYAADPHPDDTAVMDTLDLEGTVRAVLIDGKDLVAAGKEASSGRYATDLQARAYAVALIHTAGRLLVWNHREYRPLRASSAKLARLYRDSQAALRAKAAVPAQGINDHTYDSWKRGKVIDWAA